MHGPYTAVIRSERDVVATLDETEVSEGERIADRFYQGAGRATLVGFTRAAIFTAGLLVQPGETVDVAIVGRIGSEGSTLPCPRSAHGGDHQFCSECGGTKRVGARDVEAARHAVSRDDHGRLVSTLGSKFGERVFVGA